MGKVAKLLMVDPEGMYLLMHRSDHPIFGRDPDLPGGSLEGDETLVEAVMREVQEEVGVIIERDKVNELYSGTEYSQHSTYYALFVTNLEARPEITMSWEHSSYEWLDRDRFIAKARSAKDTYMHMVSDVLSR